MSDCFCGSGKGFDDCCGPVLDGSRPAASAEELMRARYSAFVNGPLDFLHDSLHPDHRADHDIEATRRWAESASWVGLEVVATEAGGADDDEGVVEFVATYKERGLVRPYHERGRFQKVDGRWFYVDGEMIGPATEARKTPKVGRNDPCPCGSGKKYKKCCGR